MKMQRHILFFFFLIISKLGFAQSDKFDQIISEIRYHSYFDSASLFVEGAKAISVFKTNGHPELEAEIYIFYGNHFYYKSESLKAKKYFEKALSIATHHKNNRLQNLSKIRLTYLEWDEGKEKECRESFQRILEDATKLKEFSNQIECYNALALMEERYSRYKKAISYYLKGLSIAEEHQEEHYIGVLLNNIGLLKLNNNQFDEALEDFSRGVKISERMNNARLTSHIYNNIALIYMEQGKKEEAMQQYHNILAYAHKSGNPRELGIAALNLSQIYHRDSNYIVAHQYCDSAIHTFKNNQYILELTKGYLGKAQFLLKEGKFSEALNYSNLALAIVDSTGNLEDAVGVHITISQIFEKQNKSTESLKEYKLYKKLNDSLNDLKNTKAITEIQARYNDEKKDAAIEKERNKNLELENKNLMEKKAAERKMIIGVITAVAIILLISIYFYASYNRKTRKQQQKFSQQLIHDIEEERNRIAKDLHDDIGQSLSAIKSKLNLIHQKEIDTSQITGVEMEVGKVIEQTRDISRKLYPAYLEKIGLTRSVARLMDGVQESSEIICSFEIEPEIDSMNINVLTHIYRIIQECVSNTMKHAEATALKVTVLKKEEHFQLIYQDNGKGLQKTDTKASGIGFMSLKERARMIQGDFNISDNSGKGFRLIINFNRS